MRTINILPLAIAVLALSCERVVTPTEPGAMVRLTIVLRTTSSHTIQKATLSFDGRDVTTANIPGGTGQIMLEGTVNGVGRGTHSIKVTIVEQASSPNAYVAAGAVSTIDRILDLAPVEGLLATGQALEIKIGL